MARTRVLVADAQPIVRLGLRALVEKEPSLEVVGEAGDGEEALRLTSLLAPHVLILDVDLPGMSAPELAQRLLAECPALRMLALSARDDSGRILVRLLEAGVAGCLSKREPVQAILGAVRRVSRGEVAFSQEQLAHARRWREEGRRWESLTEREKEILALLVRGKTNREIAQALHIAVKTVEGHVGSLLGKLGAASRAAAVAWATSNGPIEQAAGIGEITYGNTRVDPRDNRTER